MLNAILIVFHIMACFTLILVILLQVGRGHGLSGASFSQGGVQTVFGTRAADFFSKATSVMAIVFMVTCISLDVLHARRSRSLFGPSKARATQVDMEKLKQVLEKIKAEQAANPHQSNQAADGGLSKLMQAATGKAEPQPASSTATQQPATAGVGTAPSPAATQSAAPAVQPTAPQPAPAPQSQPAEKTAPAASS